MKRQISILMKLLTIIICCSLLVTGCANNENKKQTVKQDLADTTNGEIHVESSESGSKNSSSNNKQQQSSGNISTSSTDSSNDTSSKGGSSNSSTGLPGAEDKESPDSNENISDESTKEPVKDDESTAVMPAEKTVIIKDPKYSVDRVYWIKDGAAYVWTGTSYAAQQDYLENLPNDIYARATDGSCSPSSLPESERQKYITGYAVYEMTESEYKDSAWISDPDCEVTYH